MHDVVVSVFAVAGLLALVSLLPPLARRLNLPYTVLLAAVGCALGGMVLALGEAETHMGMAGDFLAALGHLDISGEAFLYIFLPTLLFEAALAVDVRRLMDDIAPVLLLAVVAVVLCTLGVGFAVAAVSGVDLRACLLLGAVVATTDPAAVVGVFRDVGAPRRLSILVEGESLFNDAAAIALSGLLVAMLVEGRSADIAGTTLAFLVDFVGGALAGYVAGRAACFAFAPLRGLRLAEITLTVALAYLSFVVADQYLHVSGVVAVVTSGLVLRSIGRTRVTPSTWHSLTETWEQLGFWASSLIFVLAAMLVPRFLTGVTAADGLALAALVIGALAARAVVLFGLLPGLTTLGLAERVSHAYKIVILWGGLRGAISLALALSVTENMTLPEDVRRFVGVLVTGFVLFTLLVNGPSLRPLMRGLGLNRLSPADRAVRERALGLALAALKERVLALAKAEDMDPAAVAAATAEIDRNAPTDKTSEATLTAEDRVYIGLAALAAHEQELYLDAFRDRLVSRQIVDRAVAVAGRLADGVKIGGRAGYQAGATAALGYALPFRAALALHRWLGATYWLAQALAGRFEMLMAMDAATGRLDAFIEERLAPLLGAEAARDLRRILTRRRDAGDEALAAMTLQYADYARALQTTKLTRAALRLEEETYGELLADSAISQEVFNDLMRQLAERWRRVDRRPDLDVALDPAVLVGRVPLFTGLGPDPLADIARLLKPRLAVPGTRIVTEGERGEAMYFIASGAVEARVQPRPVRLGSGDFFGEIALLTNRPRVADVVAMGYCRLLTLHRRDLETLFERHPDLRRHLDAVAQERLAQES